MTRAEFVQCLKRLEEYGIIEVCPTGEPGTVGVRLVKMPGPTAPHLTRAQRRRLKREGAMEWRPSS